MIEMPMRVDEVRDRICGEIGQHLYHLLAGDADSGIDKHFAFRSCKDHNISAGAFEHADVVAQLVSLYQRSRGAVLDQADKAACLRICLAGAEPPAGSRKASCSHAAQAKAATG